tara:strand:+ start:48 stop:734 length:687 start_codon:yes stop_codon:yes gene_type:complete
MPSSRDNLFSNSFEENQNPCIEFFVDIAKKNNVWVLAGSLSIKISNGKLFNRCYLINNKGDIEGYYDKIHLFDVSIPDGLTYKESDKYSSGSNAPVFQTPLANFGLTICYDIRFPNLYRDIAKHGANVIFIPSAFTEFTGKLHWHALLRSRAIETGSYIVAPAQTGKHIGGRKTFGHSIVVHPNGTILKDAGVDVGSIECTIDPKHVDNIRKQIPSLFLNSKYSIEVK